MRDRIERLSIAVLTALSWRVTGLGEVLYDLGFGLRLRADDVRARRWRREHPGEPVPWIYEIDDAALARIKERVMAEIGEDDG